MVVFCGYDYMKMNENSSWKFLKLFPESFHKVLLRTDKWQQDVCNRYIFQQQNLGKVQELLADEWVLPKCCCSAAIHHHSETHHWDNWRLWTACSNEQTNKLADHNFKGEVNIKYNFSWSDTSICIWWYSMNHSAENCNVLGILCWTLYTLCDQVCELIFKT